MPEQSPVDAARMARYSDDEINSYLAPRMAQARALGYSQDEINNHLGIKAPPAFDTTPEVSRIQTNLDAAPKPVTSFADALDAGWQISTTGLVARGAAPTKVLAEARGTLMVETALEGMEKLLTLETQNSGHAAGLVEGLGIDDRGGRSSRVTRRVGG